jgi:hypothetical protein
MSDDRPSSAEQHKVVSFRGRGAPIPQGSTPPSPDDLSKFEQGAETDDYRHRMIVNVVAFIFIVALIGAGYWLADTMAKMRKNQDCVLSGRRGCTPVEVNKDR